MTIAALTNLRTLLADCEAFRAWVGAADATEAKARIYRVAEDAADATRPFALVAAGDDDDSEFDSAGAANFFAAAGSLILRFEADVRSKYSADDAKAEIDFSNQVGTVLAEMKALAGSGAYLNIREIDMTMPPARSSIEEQEAGDDYFQIELEVRWGV